MNDWLPLATTIGGTAVGLAGVYATLRSGKRQQETALLVARQQGEFQALLAAEERQQRRREDAYARLIDWVSECEGLRTELAKLDQDSPLDDIRSHLIAVTEVAQRHPPGSASIVWSDAVLTLATALHAHLLIMAPYLGLWLRGHRGVMEVGGFWNAELDKVSEMTTELNVLVRIELKSSHSQ